MTDKPKRPRGRPKKPEGHLETLPHKISLEAKTRLTKHAETLGLTLSEYARSVLESWLLED